ncbi:BF3164 family lipoprotein [Sphingobacterium sp. FBM7-1]|uniref:BF3164 family lipoprotein n=1 Tax=Sphingobacterium sp. FBM7-1 TaxID=2886688 RepID=UPI001D0FC7C7|nr:BF3164 family lipoprotein [Sphingobacterium sp. FBM7-1]MCC2599273.1 TolB-like 6-bladed beta-propeller domain-containing protein [Sphingobacterium sp. FBM7-1]
MKNVLYLKVFFSASIILFSCNRKSHDTKELLNNAIPVQSNEIAIDFLLGKPTQIAICNDTLVITDNIEEKILAFYDIKNNQFLGRQLQVGQGPDEVIPPLLLSRTNESGLLSVLQRQNGKHMEYDIGNLVNGHLKPSKLLDLGIADRIVQTGEGFVTTGPYEKGSIKVFDNKGDMVKNYNIYPQYIKDLSERENQYVLGQGHIAYNKGNKVLAFASYFLGEASFYRLSGDSLQLLQRMDLNLSDGLYKRIINSRGVVQITDTDLEYFSDIYATADYFYLLYTGMPRKDKNSVSHSYILKFSPKGNLIDTYKTDRKIHSFCIRDDDEKGYAIALSKDMDYVLVEMNL